MANLNKRLTDLERAIKPEGDEEQVIITWEADDRITVKRRKVKPGEHVEPGIKVDWSLPDEKPKQATD